MNSSVPAVADQSHSIGSWLAASPIASFIRAFIATLLTLALADWTSAASVSFDNWKSWVIAALAASVPVIIRWINPQDAAYGRGSKWRACRFARPRCSKAVVSEIAMKNG